MKAKIFEIKRFSVHDGDGIRTTVFFKGCPLKCVWCHNPEGIDFNKQLAFYEHKCISCGHCINSCAQGAHKLADGIHRFDRNLCLACGNCVDACFSRALTLYGREMSVDEIFDVVMEDKDFYTSTGGGVTLSGGECLMYADFCAQLLKKLSENGINTAVDTCGFVPKESIDKVIPYTDVFLYDIKAIDEDVHIRCTERSNVKILENLKYIDSCGKDIEIRIPYVPGFNDDQVEKIRAFLSQLNNIKSVKVLPYHNYAGSKYAALDMVNTLPSDMPDNEEISKAENILSNKG